MKALAILLTALCTLTATAEPEKTRPAFYAAPIMGIGIMDDATATPSGSDSINVPVDAGAVFGAEFGIQFENFRADLSITRQNNEADGFTYFDGFATYFISGVSITQLHTMLNAYYNFNNSTPFTPFVGAGAGINMAKVEIGLDNDSSTYFAAQIGGGISAELSEWLALDLAYKFILSDEYEISVPGIGTASADLTSHQILLSARFMF